MRSFNLIYEEFCRNIVKEGGNAFDNVSRIKREKINKVVDDFKKTIISKFLGKDPKESMFLLGSTGKKKDSGDIDIGLDSNILNDSILVSLMKLDEKCAENKIRSYINTINFNMLHVCWPQDSKKFVQIDLLLTAYPEFTKFFMFSPTEDESRYKGAHRNILLRSIILATTISDVQYDNKKPIRWFQYDINDQGIFKQVKTLIDENGKPLLYKNTNEPLELEYAKVESSIPVTHDVDEAIKFIVGDFKVEEIDTFEKLFDIIVNNENFKYKDPKIIKTILKISAKKCKAAQDRLSFPDELEPYI